METQLICPNDECNEIPIIKLITQNKNYIISIDCSTHHYKFKLEEYLNIINYQKKEYNNICTEHNSQFDGFLKDININVCKFCEFSPNFEKINFESFSCENITYDRVFNNQLLNKLYIIIIENYVNGIKQNKLVAALYLNKRYINLYKTDNLIINNNQENYFYLKNQLNIFKHNDKICYNKLNKNKQILKIYQNDLKEMDDNILENLSNRENEFVLNCKFFIRIFRFENLIVVLKIEKGTFLTAKYESYNFIRIELSPFYEQIFMTISLYDIRIWEISEDTQKILNKITLYLPETYNKIKLSKFSTINEKMIFSVSTNNSIRIWNLEKIFNISECNNIPKDNIINDIVFSSKESIIGILTKKSIFIYDIKLNKIINTINKKYLYFNFINSNEFIIIDYNYIKKMTMNNEVIMQIKFNFIYEQTFYFYNNDYLLYIFMKDLFYIDLNQDQKTKIKVNKIKNDEFNFSHIKILDNIPNNDNICLNFCSYDSDFIYFYSFVSNEFFDNNKIFPLKKVSNYFWKKKLKRIYGKFELSFENIIINNNEIHIKQYLKNKYVNEKISNNFKINLEIKKKNVENLLKNYEIKNTLKEQFYYLIDLIIQDNTNKQLIIKYLQFLKENDDNLNEIYHEKYKNELNDYKVLFTPNELKIYFNENKLYDEKEEFINYITTLNNINNENEFIKIQKEINRSKLGLFNQNIDFYKNKELYWYRNKKLILYALTKFNYDKFILMKYCIQKALEKNLFKKNHITQNKMKLTYILINMVCPQKNEICDYNLNLIDSEKYQNSELKAKLLKFGFKKKSENEYFLNNENNIIDTNKDINICIENYILNEKKELKLNKNELLIFDDSINNFIPKINLQKIKNYFLKFLTSNLLKEAFSILYSEKIVFPFENIENAKNYINKNLNFIPIMNKTINGVTDKFTSETYIFIKERKINNIPTSLDNNKKNLILEMLYSGAINKTNIHELNHNFYNMYYYHSNCSIPLKTPRKTILGELRESGREIELLLFGRIIYSLTFEQICYLLNEKNFEKGVIEFKNGFQNLNKEDLIIEGEFSYFNQIRNFECFPLIKSSTSILAENYDEFCSIGAEDDNDDI